MDIYKLDNDLFFDSSNSKLIFKKQTKLLEVSLDNLEKKVLSKLLENNGDLVSKSELLDLWPTNVVMEHSLLRVISNLRKKLHTLESTLNLVETIPREGYKFIGQYQPVDRTALECTNKKRKKYLYQTAVIFLLYILGLASFIFILPTHVKSNSQTTLQKKDISISPTQYYLTYSAKNAEEKNWFIKIWDKSSHSLKEIKKQGYDLTSPIWLSKNKLVYMEQSDQVCNVIIGEFTTYLVKKSTVTHCNPEIKTRTLIAYDEHHILMSDSPNQNSPMLLYKINVLSGVSERITLEDV